MTTPYGRQVAPAPRRGAGLAEIIVAMVIFAIIATSYAAISLRFATRMRSVSAGAARSAALTEYMARLASVPFDSLSNRAGTFTTTGDFPNTRVITVTGSGTTRTVTLLLVPTRTDIKPDTVIMTRVRASTASPLGP